MPRIVYCLNILVATRHQCSDMSPTQRGTKFFFQLGNPHYSRRARCWGSSTKQKPQWFLQEAIQRRKLRATDWDHTALLSILRFKEPVLHLLRLVRRVSCRSTANGLEKTVLGRLMETVLQNEWRVALGKSGTRAQGVAMCVCSNWANSWVS